MVLLSPPDEYAERIKEAGFRWLPFPFSRRGTNLLAEGNTILKLARVYRAEKPDIVHHFTIKCVLYGSLSAKLTGVRSVVNSITGLGYVFINQHGLTELLVQPVKLFYRYALQHSKVVFQNRDDQAYFLESKLVNKNQCSLIRGSGVDVTKFQVTNEPEGVPIVVLPGRMLWDKGVREFVEAARRFKQENIPARFVLVGDIDLENPASVPETTLKQWEDEGVVEWWRWQSDMPAVYAGANVVCLPSYREGVPRTLLEAAASGRAMVATDVPGCREVVIEGITGYLVPVKNSQILAERLKLILANKELRQKMGREGRKLVEKEFETGRVLRETAEVYSTILGHRGDE